MGAHMIVVVAPVAKDAASVSQAVEHLLVQAFIAELVVERLDEAVLLGIAQRDVAPADPGRVPPFEDRPAGQLAAIVADDGLGRTVDADQRIQLARDTPL